MASPYFDFLCDTRGHNAPACFRRASLTQRRAPTCKEPGDSDLESTIEFRESLGRWCQPTARCSSARFCRGDSRTPQVVLTLTWPGLTTGRYDRGDRRQIFSAPFLQWRSVDWPVGVAILGIRAAFPR